MMRYSLISADGFRKIKSDISSVESPYWEFRHPKFVRGMPHLLFEIKRTIQGTQ